MCESSAYSLKDGKEKLLFERIDLLENTEDKVKLVNLFGEEMSLKAKVKTLSLVDHKIILVPS